MMPMFVRHATLDDLDALSSIESACFPPKEAADIERLANRIETYPEHVQNLFLLNPIYLFIRYFRKIVIEATVPSAWFHLLMLADVAVVAGLGCWMYKKYNTRFLYYV